MERREGGRERGELYIFDYLRPTHEQNIFLQLHLIISVFTLPNETKLHQTNNCEGCCSASAWASTSKHSKILKFHGAGRFGQKGVFYPNQRLQVQPSQPRRIRHCTAQLWRPTHSPCTSIRIIIITVVKLNVHYHQDASDSRFNLWVQWQELAVPPKFLQKAMCHIKSVMCSPSYSIPKAWTGKVSFMFCAICLVP